ncbi:hypothetical protein EHN06_13825 [Marinobacter sp. NP-4(2019)]|uniref:hypothetical protein n=1 Tax=Marinobacter sp. NP-4(2019) TaxID=2488665 RepID=UPI000FC3E46C|nr:hypothetical protein [Marinobacter sp. NP-4(2019)]AZT84532.1 hypothetical protein EHN06_13825 [Marinobacter sp. NP-4(2019)]
MQKFIHLGMPKALSSALQESFFSKHEDIHFLGVGVGSLIDYVNDPINRIFETLIPYSNNDFYQSNKGSAIADFGLEIRKAVEHNKKWVGVSSEWLGFNFTPEMVEPDIKMKRLAEVVGSDAKIIFLTRSNFSFVKSLWAELVKVGLPKLFSEYCQYLWDFQDRSCLYEMLYDLQYSRVVKYFGRENIHIVPLEKFRSKNGELTETNQKIDLISYLCRALDVNYPSNFMLPSVNPSLSNKELFHKLELNKKYRHDFGNLLFEPSNIHRSRKQLEWLGSAEDKDVFRDVKMKRLLLEQAKLAAKKSNSEVSYELPKSLAKNLSQLFIESNQRFEEMSGITLPDQYFQPL